MTEKEHLSTINDLPPNYIEPLRDNLLVDVSEHEWQLNRVVSVQEIRELCQYFATQYQKMLSTDDAQLAYKTAVELAGYNVPVMIGIINQLIDRASFVEQ